MTEVEVLNNDIHDVLERSTSPKDIEYHDKYKMDNRPEMEVHDGYEKLKEETVGSVPLGTEIDTNLDDSTEWAVKNNIPLPCVRERFFSPNPDHWIRFTGVIHLYSAGFSPEEVQDIIRQIGWVNYNPEITKKMTEQVYKREYSELPCRKLQSKGLCIFGPDFEDYSDDPKDCDTYKWTSGEVYYGRI